MDHSERLVKVEAVADEHEERMNRFDIRFDRIDDSIASLRDHIDQGLAAQPLRWPWQKAAAPL